MAPSLRHGRSCFRTGASLTTTAGGAHDVDSRKPSQVRGYAPDGLRPIMRSTNPVTPGVVAVAGRHRWAPPGYQT